jgi:hypothetical protein
MNILAQHSISLTATKNGLMGSRKPEDGKEETQRKKEMEYHVNAVLLNNNEIRDLRGIYDTLKDWVLFDIEKLQWLNLSYNYLVKIDEDICNFTNLKTL